MAITYDLVCAMAQRGINSVWRFTVGHLKVIDNACRSQVYPNCERVSKLKAPHNSGPHASLILIDEISISDRRHLAVPPWFAVKGTFISPGGAWHSVAGCGGARRGGANGPGVRSKSGGGPT